MKILTGNEAIRARNTGTRISASAFTQSPHLDGMYRLSDGMIAEHHVEFGVHHRLLIVTNDEATAMRTRTLNRWTE